MPPRSHAPVERVQHDVCQPPSPLPALYAAQRGAPSVGGRLEVERLGQPRVGMRQVSQRGPRAAVRRDRQRSYTGPLSPRARARARACSTRTSFAPFALPCAVLGLSADSMQSMSYASPNGFRALGFTMSTTDAAQPTAAQPNAQPDAAPTDAAKPDAHLLLLLHTEPCFAGVLNRKPTEPFDNDHDYLAAAELRFTLQSLYVQALSTLRAMVVGGSRSAPYADCIKPTADRSTQACSPSETAARVASLKALQEAHAACCASRLALTSPAPRVLAVAEAYALSEKEATVLELLVLQRSHRTSLFSSCLMGDGFGVDSEDALVPTLSGVSLLEMAAFFEEERPHVKEGVVIIDEDYGGRKSSSLSTEACDAIVNGLRDRPESYRKPFHTPGSTCAGEAKTLADKAAKVKLEKLRLKLSGTKLLEALDGMAGGSDLSTPAANGTTPNGHAAAAPPATAEVQAEAAATAATAAALAAAEATIAAMAATGAEDEAAADAFELLDDADAEADLTAVLAQAAAGSSSAAAGASADADSAPAVASDFDGEVRGYDSELEYLDDQFATLVQRIQVAAEVQKRRVKQAEVEDNPAPWEGKSKKVNVAELQAKLRISEAKIAARLACAGGKLGVPRLEGLCTSLQLDAFEKSVLLITCGYTISPVVKQLLAQTSGSHSYDSDRLSVGRILQVFTTSFHEQVSRRTYFYKSARLVKKGLIRLNNDRYQARDDLTDMLVRLDRRVLDCLVGLEDESGEVAESASLYSPSVEFGEVVLPAQVSAKLLRMLSSHHAMRAYNRRVGLSKDIPQPDGLVLLLCGPSGSGKTMTANAVARKMGKKLLLVNFPVLARTGGSHGSASSSVQSIFREAELANAVVFFDECESLFAKRGHGGSSEMTELLTEIERFDGIVFLATNRPQDLDEAMFRRIRCVFELPAPNHVQRLQIWKQLTAANGIALADDVDLHAIAAKYEITGGYIRNAVLAALLAAVGRDSKAPRLSQDDLHAGCREQMRGALQGAELESRHVPTRSLDELVVPPPLLGSLRSLVALEKARAILNGLSWGGGAGDGDGDGDGDERPLDERAAHARGGTTALFWGPPGCGKRAAAEALAFELGRPMKLVHLAQIAHLGGSGNGGGRGSKSQDGVAALFREARLADALLVIMGIEGGGGGGGGEGGGGGGAKLLELLLHEMARYPGVVVLCASSYDRYDAVVHAIAPTLLAAMRTVVEFTLPDAPTRERLWRTLLPRGGGGKVDYDELAAESHGFNIARISNAIYQAAASVVLDDPDATVAGTLTIGMKPLRQAVKAEKAKASGTHDALQRAMLC